MKIIITAIVVLTVIMFFMPYFTINFAIIEEAEIVGESQEVVETLTANVSGMKLFSAMGNNFFVLIFLLLAPLYALISLIRSINNSIFGGLYANLSGTFVVGIILTTIHFFWVQTHLITDFTPVTFHAALEIFGVDTIQNAEWRDYATPYITSILPSFGFIITIALYAVGILLCGYFAKKGVAE